MDMHADLWRAELGISPLSWHPGSVAAGIALGLGVGRIHVEGSGYAGARADNAWLFDIEGGAWIRRSLVGGLFVVVSADVVVPVVRSRVTRTDSAGTTAEAFRAQAVGGLGSLRLGYLFSS